MRALFTGVSGMRAHQTRMDVIGNNIANVNTVAYKSSNVSFSELLYQTTQGASGPNNDTNRGGKNPMQVGLGVKVGAINTNITQQGATQTTNNPFDLQINGDSFFIVNDGKSNCFTRAGAFCVDADGNLVMTSNGYKVMGWQEDENNPGTIQKDTVSPLKILSDNKRTSEPEATKEGYISGIIDKNSDNLSSENGQMVNIPFYDNLGYSYNAKYSMYNTDKDGNKLEDGIYRMELKDVIDKDGKSITSEGGNLEDFVSINNNGANTIYAKYDKENGSFIGYWNSVEKPSNYDDDTNFISNENADNKISMKFDTNKNPNFTDNININLKNSKMYNNNSVSTIAGHAGDYNGNYAGKKIGTMSGVSIQQDGKIYATYDNGTSKLLGQIAVANFANPSGLEKLGDNLYQTTQNSGAFDGIGEDITASGSGSFTTGALEMSNVDLSAEFTDMIITQRGFQANSRIITVADSMLEEVLNIKR